MPQLHEPPHADACPWRIDHDGERLDGDDSEPLCTCNHHERHPMTLTRFALLSADGAVICGTHASTPALLLPETTEEIKIDGIHYYAAAGMGIRTRNGDRVLCASAT